MIKNGEIVLIVNTVEESRTAVRDSYSIRRAALQGQVALYTTLSGARAACHGMEHSSELRPYSVQDMHARLSTAATQGNEAAAIGQPA
jgi:carbamoyl-phosphate synthase large subunit